MLSETLRTRRLREGEAIVPGWFVLEFGNEFGATAVLDRRVVESGHRGYQQWSNTIGRRTKAGLKSSYGRKGTSTGIFECYTGRTSVLSPRAALTPQRQVEQGVARL